MKLQCIICMDLFVERSDVSALQCGHLFHTACIFRWNQSSNTCPTCRGEYTRVHIMKLFLNCREDRGAPDLNSLDNELNRLRSEIAERDGRLMSQEGKIIQLVAHVNSAELKATTLTQKYLRCDSQRKLLQLKQLEMNQVINRVKACEVENQGLKQRIAELKRVETVVCGTQQDVDEMLRNYDSPNAVRELAISCSLLKRELAHLRDAKQNQKVKMLDLERQISYKNKKIHELGEEILNLQVKLQQLQTLVDTTNDSLQQASAGSSENEPVPPVDVHSKTPVVNQVHSGPAKRFKVNVAPFHKTLKFPFCNITNAFDEVPLSGKLKFPAPEDEDTVIRNGYDGFGGHTKFVKPLIRDKVNQCN